MSKIEFDAKKVYRSAAAIRAEESRRIYEKYAEALKDHHETAKMDESTKSAIEDLLRTVKRGPSVRDFAAERARAMEESRRAAADAYEIGRREREERMAREALEAERRRRDYEARMERERLEREEAERVRREIERHREHFAQLSNPPRMLPQDALKREVAALSVNPAKACVVLRAMMCEALVAQIEREVPATKRVWNGLDGIWEFHPTAMAQVRGILGLYFADIQVVGVPKATPATKFDQLFAKLTKDDKNKIYRLLAGAHHPDKGGDPATMTLINLVFKEK